MKKYTVGVVLLVLAAASTGSATHVIAHAAHLTVVLSDPQDPFYALAMEISATETLPLTDRLEEALLKNPDYLLWVVSPSRLSERQIVAFSAGLQNHSDGVSSGIITGSSLGNARALWQRAAHAGGGAGMYAVIGSDEESHRSKGQIIDVLRSPPGIEPLDIPSLQRILQDAGYVSYAGHGSRTGWGIDVRTRESFRARDLPSLPSTVISTGSCETMQLWQDNSIALAFTDKGAAAYSGFVFSPNSGYLLGSFGQLPFRYTWPEFPIGHVVWIQGRATLKGYARFNFHCLLGDPRISLHNTPPYTLVEDRVQDQTRMLRFTDAPAGVIPVRIPGSAEYKYVEVSGLEPAWENDRFYNGLLQFANIREDKYLLFLHKGGDFQIRLRSRAPLVHRIANPIVDSLDHAYIFSFDTGGKEITFILNAIVLVIVGVRLSRHRDRLPVLLYAAVPGLLFSMIHLAYGVLRMPHVSVTNKPLLFNASAPITTLILITAGAFFFLLAKGNAGRIAGLLTATLLALSGVILGSILLALVNQSSQSRIGAGLFNYALVSMNFIAWLMSMLCCGLAFFLVRRWLSRRGLNH